MADKRTESSEARTSAGQNLRMAVKRFDLSGGREEETWDFLCECAVVGCQEWVTLPVSRYEMLRQQGVPILAPGHSPDDARRSRRMSRRLVEEARALRAQAEVQLKRAARNLKHTPPDEPR